MAYGEIKVDTVTFTDGGIDKSVSISGLVQNPTFSGNITVTGTISGNTIQGQTVSGVTVTGTTAAFTSGTFTTITGGTATITSGVFASGTAAAPSVSVGTTDNGIYSPGTDQVAVATNGTGRLFVDASGNVGVGTSSVNALLEVNNSTAGGEVQRIEGNYSGSGSVTLTNWRRAGGSVAAAFKYNDDSSPLCMSIGTTTSHEFRIRTADTDAITIDASQQVGIGTTSPQAKLEIAQSSDNTDGPKLRIANNGNTLSNGQLIGGIDFFDGDDSGEGVGAYIYSYTTDSIGRASGQDLRFGAGESERARIDSSGNVGIGTTSPGAKLDVVGNVRVRGSATPTLTFNDGAIENNLSITNSAFVLSVPSANPITFNTTNTERLRITSAGLVGIGTSTPSYKLDVSVATNDPTTGSPAAGSFVQVAGGTTTVGNGPSVSLSNASGAKETFWRMSAVTTSGNNGDLVFNGYNGGATYPERLRITAAGNVGIGTASPNGNTNYGSLDLNGSAGGEIFFSSGGVSRGNIFNYSSTPANLGIAATDASGQIIFNTGGYTERVRIDSSGNLLVGTSTSTSYYGGTAKSYITDQGGTTLPLALEAFRNDSAGAYLVLGHSRSGTAGNYTILQSDDGLGFISFNGSDGTDLESVGATIKAEVDGTPGANDMPGRLVFSTTADGASSPTERMRITSGGNVGIGTTTVNNGVLHVKSNGTGSQSGLAVEASANDSFFSITNNGSTHTLGATYNSTGSYQPISFDINGEKARIDTSGRLLVGTSSSFDANCTLQAVGGNAAQFFRWGADGCNVYIGCARGTQGSPSTLNNGDIIGSLKFRGHDGSAYRDGASITAVVDATTGASDFPSRLEFSTTADGASSPTERMRITSAGAVGIGTTSPVIAGAGYNGLTVNGSTGGTIYLQGGGTSSGRLVATSTDFYIGTVQAGGNLIFQHQDGSYERARIDSSGRLLVGTSSSPSLTIGQYAKIHLVGNTADAAGDSVLNLGRGILASSGIAANTPLGILQFTDSAGAAHATIIGATDATTGSNDYPGRLVFSTTADGASSPTERMRIQSDGNILIGVTSGATGLLNVGPVANKTGIFGSASTAGSAGIQGAHTANSATGYVAYFANSGSATGLYISNTAAWQSTSDERLKTDIQDLDAVSRLMQIKPRSYLWKSQATSDEPTKRNLGFIAQEVQEVFPELVGESPDGMLSVEYTGLIAPLVNTIQFLKAEIDALKAEVTALKAQ
jgi:hypothetical protein